MIKRYAAILLSAIFALTAAQALAQTPEAAGPPVFEVETEFEVNTVIVPNAIEVYAGQTVTFLAITTYSSNKADNQWLHFVSDRWAGVDLFDKTQEVTLIIDFVPAAQPNERLAHFVSAAALTMGFEPGDYDVQLKYVIILKHDESGFRTYETTTTTQVITITVLPGEPLETGPEEEEEPGPGAEALNHGQIVSAWAHWKQTKGNQNFLPGGPLVPHSLNWYKAQVEYLTFYSQQEVWDYLDSIYEPAQRDNKAPNLNKGPRNNKAPNPNKGPGNNNSNKP
ncbi:MAG: hypothetical protein PHP02_02185 [Eubacteriales bacterium]|nr:hypothetical protein [Eubacteriales bacterium]